MKKQKGVLFMKHRVLLDICHENRCMYIEAYGKGTYIEAEK